MLGWRRDLFPFRPGRGYESVPLRPRRTGGHAAYIPRGLRRALANQWRWAAGVRAGWAPACVRPKDRAGPELVDRDRRRSAVYAPTLSADQNLYRAVWAIANRRAGSAGSAW